ncbi:MAG: dephospho-CoA kinase [Desulfobacteraceae bacterium]|nr:dephospho-CoA kinase [Desulfobacteraceae bacterium]
MRHKKIALTGGIATGKTTVANRFRELGALILDADEYARRVVEPGTPSAAALRELIGPGYYHANGTLKRRELRERIIEDPALRDQLDAVLHPFILQAMWSEWEKRRERNPGAVIIFDIPLLFEGGFDRDFDVIILVFTQPGIQARRLAERDCISLPEAQRTLSIQFPIESKKVLSDFVIENSGSLEITLEQTDKIWKTLSE